MLVAAGLGPPAEHALIFLLALNGLRLAELRPSAALGDLLAAGDLFARLRSPSPSVAPWRSDAALAHLALGEPGEARTLAAEEVALAQAYHGPRTLGIALRSAGLTEGRRRGIELLPRRHARSTARARDWSTPAP